MTMWDDTVVCHSAALACNMISGSSFLVGVEWGWIQRRLRRVCVLLRHFTMHAVQMEKMQEQRDMLQGIYVVAS